MISKNKLIRLCILQELFFSKKVGRRLNIDRLVPIHNSYPTSRKFSSKHDTKTFVCLFEITTLHWEAVNKKAHFLQKYPIWKWCCHEEIPQNELIEIIQKYDDLSDPDLWHNIYMNWLAWKSIKYNINFDIVTSATEIPRITCIAVAGL